MPDVAVLKKISGHLIKGVEDYQHIPAKIHPSVSLAELTKDIELASFGYIKEKEIFTNFNGWQSGMQTLLILLRKRTG